MTSYINIAQNTNYYDITPKENLVASPDVIAFHKYNSLPVNLYTGKVNINLPLYEIKSGQVKIPISISYNTGGVKVDDVASNVGLGWNLNASGSIINIIKDLHDQKFKTGVVSDNDWDSGSESCRYVTTLGYFSEYPDINSGGSISPYCQDYDGWAEEDASPDVFIANAPGLSSRFILEKNNNDQYDVLPIDNSGLINSAPISYVNLDVNPLGFTLGEMGYGDASVANANPWATYGGFGGYDSFELVNDKGIEYTFDKIDLKESLVRKKGFHPGIITTGNNANNTTTSHHLSSIKDRSNNTEVLFNYDEYQKPTLQYERAVMDDALTGNVNSSYLQNKVFGFIPKFTRHYNNAISEYEESFFKTSVTFAKYTKLHRLNEIVYDGGRVQFLYNHNRLDSDDEKALTDIIIRDNNNQIVQKFVFHYDYFISKENCSEKRCKRLKLLRVVKIGSDNSSSNLYDFEYEYTNPLPKVNSLQQDFLGYYNNNGVSTPDFHSLDFSTKHPELYYHPNKGVNSILPFPIQGQSYTVIPGDYSLQPNANYSKSGILKAIQYELGGKSEFEYESHQFNFLGGQYIAGGTRIKRQKLTDSNNDVRIFDYTYLNDDGSSSGYINNLPVFGYPLMWYPITPTNNVSFVVYDRPRSALELTDGSFIGYSQVLEKEIGNGSTKYRFTSPETHVNNPESYVNGTSYGNSGSNQANQNAIAFLRNNSAYPSSCYVDNDILRGKLIFQLLRDESGNPVKRIDFEYSRKIFNTIYLNYRDVLDNYRTDNQNGTIGVWILNHTSLLNIERNLQTKKTVTEYLDSGVKITEEFFDYANEYPFIKEHRLVDDLGEVKTRTYYPFDIELNGVPYMGTLTNQNRISEEVKKEVLNDDNLLSTSLINYKPFGGFSHYLPKSVSVSKGDNSLEEGNVIDLRDDKGNIIQYTRKNGISYCIIWGHNKTVPIAKIENTTYSDIEDLPGFGSGFQIQSGLSATQEYNLRNMLPNAMVTTYTYAPLIGVTSITDPRGNTIYYEYDEFNRLKHVKDKDDNILSKNDYNYANQN